MRKALLVLCVAAAGCVAPPAGLGPVDYPAEPESHWIKSGPPGSTPKHETPTDELVKDFAEDNVPVSAVRADASADNFHGSRLFDGFDFELQPLDPQGKPVKRLGHLSVILCEFNINKLSAKGRELMRWHVPASRMARLWTEGSAGECYHMKLAWTVRPLTDYVRMDVRFTTLDGKTFTVLKTPSSIDQPRYRWLHK